MMDLILLSSKFWCFANYFENYVCRGSKYSFYSFNQTWSNGLVEMFGKGRSSN